MDERPFAGKCALVTGAAVRIGRTLALRLAALGCDVAIHYGTSRAEAMDTVTELQSRGVRAAAVQADLADAQARGNLLADAQAAMGRPLDLLVNNASSFPRTRLDSLTRQQVAESVTVDAWAPFELTRDFAHRATRGAVVNLVDARIDGVDWEHVGYHLAKRMLRDFTLLCALEYAPRVRVNAVAPGPTLPPPGVVGQEAAQLMERMRAALPLRRNPTPDDLADGAIYLLGAPAVTGQVLFVDGGRHLARLR